MKTVPILLVLAAILGAIALQRQFATRHAPWVRPCGATADRVLARIRASGEITVTHGPTADTQTSLLAGPVRLHGTLTPPNLEDLERPLAGLRAFAKPRQSRSIWNSLDEILEIAVDERALTAWLTWVVAFAQRHDIGLTNVELRRLPSGRLIVLDLSMLGEWDGPRPGDQEEPRTYIKLRRGRLPPQDDRQVIKVSPFAHYVHDEYEVVVDGEYRGPPPARYVASLPSVVLWNTTPGRRLLANRLGRVRALLREDLGHLDQAPLDVIVEPLYTRMADMPAYVVLDVLAGLRDLPGIRLQYGGMIEGW